MRYHKFGYGYNIIQSRANIDFLTEYEYEYIRKVEFPIFVFEYPVFGDKYSNIQIYSNFGHRILDIRIWILEIQLCEYIRIRIRSKIVFCKGRISEYIRIFEFLSPNTGYSNTNIGNSTLRIYSYSYSVKKSIFALLC